MTRHRKVSSLHSAASQARTTSVIMKQVDATSAISALTVASCASSTALADTRTALERRVARGARGGGTTAGCQAPVSSCGSAG